MNKKTYQWVEDATTRYEREIINAKRRVTYHKNQEKKGMNAFVRNSFLVLVVIGTVSIPTSNFFAFNTVSFRNPVVIEKRTSDFHSPISVVSARETVEKAIPTPTQGTQKDVPSDEEKIVKAVKHGDVLWKQYQLETQRGLTDYCRNNNQGFGGFGVKDGNTIVCYDTFNKAVERASYWADQLMEGRSLHSYLCKWSGAGDVADCLYARSYEFVK